MNSIELLPSERLETVKRALRATGHIRISEASQTFGVSGETIRRDLKRLADRGFAELVRGGARWIDTGKDGESGGSAGLPPVTQRANALLGEKRAIGRRAAELVQEGQVVLLDSGTTTAALARELKVRQRLTVITNSILVVNEIADCSDWNIHVVGGELSPGSMSLTGLRSIEELRNTSVDIAFLGAAGVSPQRGFTSANPLESELKLAMMSIAHRVAIVADHSKLRSSGFATFARPDEINVFVTSTGADQNALDAFEADGVEIIVA